MSDWLGVGFFVLVIIGIYFGIKTLGNQPKRTEQDFENRVSDGTGLMNSGVNALNELLNPNEAKAKEVKVQLKEGRFNKKKREGKGNGNLENE
ncbi:MAG: hypothetical protein AAB336_08245 [Acidobacteriota bacterium]